MTSNLCWIQLVKNSIWVLMRVITKPRKYSLQIIKEVLIPKIVWKGHLAFKRNKTRVKVRPQNKTNIKHTLIFNKNKKKLSRFNNRRPKFKSHFYHSPTRNTASLNNPTYLKISQFWHRARRGRNFPASNRKWNTTAVWAKNSNRRWTRLTAENRSPAAAGESSWRGRSTTFAESKPHSPNYYRKRNVVRRDKLG
jgi:hypothetical protein